MERSGEKETYGPEFPVLARPSGKIYMKRTELRCATQISTFGASFLGPVDTFLRDGQETARLPLAIYLELIHTATHIDR
jgi:hypothetical protein